MGTRIITDNRYEQNCVVPYTQVVLFFLRIAGKIVLRKEILKMMNSEDGRTWDWRRWEGLGWCNVTGRRGIVLDALKNGVEDGCRGLQFDLVSFCSDARFKIPLAHESR